MIKVKVNNKSQEKPLIGNNDTIRNTDICSPLIYGEFNKKELNIKHIKLIKGKE